MRTKLFALIIVIGFQTLSSGQETEKILNEGKLLFRTERASWYGTDDFLARFANIRDSIGGYLSYVGDDQKVVNIFFKRSDPFQIIVRYYFDSLPQVQPLIIDTLNHTPTSLEKDLITIRKDALRRISENKDNFFTYYENTSFNLIPLISNGEKKVFVLTGPKESNIVLIGNDYLLTYDSDNNFLKNEKIHNSMLKFPCKSDKPDNKLETTFHSHIVTDCISSTDICTLLLYKPFIEWKQHYVMSKKYVSIFDLEKELLVIITKKAWDKINKHQKNKK